MSGHSKWSTIKRKKGANDAKRGQLFAKLVKAIEIAARNGGTDPANNASLYQAIQKAKSNSVPNENIERALKRVDGNLETGEIFGEVGHIIESPRTVTAVAVTNSIIRVIDEKTVKEKMNKADPVLAAIIRGLSLRIGDANALAEKHWLELSLYKSLGK